MSASFSVQALLIGLLAAVVGFIGSFAVILQGLGALGATETEAAAGLAATSLAMGALTIVLSLRTRMPISIVWSTPGAALLAASSPPSGGVAAGAGIVLLVGLLLVAAGSWRPFGRWMASIPAALANGMLAGILFEFCLSPVRAARQLPIAALVVFATWLVVARFKRLYAVPVAAIVAVGWAVAQNQDAFQNFGPLWPQFALTLPAFSVSAAIGLAMPLFIVTMASQNLPGLAVLAANDYRPAVGPIFVSTGIATAAVSVFGGVPLNLAALTAALCAGSDADRDPGRRYWAAVAAGGLYIVLGILAAIVTRFVSFSPLLIQEVAGLALLGAFGGAMLGALTSPNEREAAAITFLVTASGFAAFGIGAAFWGLLAGGVVLFALRWRGT